MMMNLPCPAKTVLGFMIAPLMGNPAFIARLIPIYSLSADILYEQINILIKIIHDVTGVIYGIISDK